VTGCWRKLYNEQLHNLYSSPSVIRMIKSTRIGWAVHVAQVGEKRNAYRIFVGKPEGKKPLGRQRSGWTDNIKMDRRDIGWGGMDWIDLAQDRPVEGSCEHGNEPSGSIKCWEALEDLAVPQALRPIYYCESGNETLQFLILFPKMSPILSCRPVATSKFLLYPTQLPPVKHLWIAPTQPSDVTTRITYIPLTLNKRKQKQI
jgi:hypothetical protein